MSRSKEKAWFTKNHYDPLLHEYSRLAPRYEQRWYSYVNASVRETLRRMPLKPGDRVLDVGCGTGYLLEVLAHTVPYVQLAGVDLSGKMLEVARCRLGKSVDLKEARAEALPFPDASFDVVVSTSVFHYIREPVVALHEMFRVLKPLGRIVITDWCHDFLACRLYELFLIVFHRPHFKIYSTKECQKLLEDAGFAQVCVEQYRITWLWGLMTAVAMKTTPPR